MMGDRGSVSGSHRFGVLDGWRGIAAIAVALYHFRFYSHIGLSPFMLGAYLFVDFFFVLSGFVIAYTYAGRLTQGTDVAEFGIRRFGRLWPLHISVLAFLFLLELLKAYLSARGWVHFADRPFDPAGQHSWASLPVNALLLQTFDLNGGLTWNFPSWSIGAEFWCYLVFAALCWSGRRALTVGGLFCIALGFTVVPLAGKGMEVSYELGFFRGLLGFFTGYFVFRAWRWHQARPSVDWVGWAEIPVLLAVVLFLSYAARTDAAILAPVLFAPVVFVFAHEKGIVSRVLRARPVALLGAWSYSIYMIHFTIVELSYWVVTLLEKETHQHLRMHIPGTGQGLFGTIGHNLYLGDALYPLYAAAVIALSALTYRAIEKPGRAYFNSLAVRRRLQPAE